MEKLLAATAIIFALGATGSLASDAELQTWCEGFADRNGVPRTPCACIVSAIGSNATLKTEMMSMATIAQYHDTKSQALAVAVDPCVPPPQ
jgi:hypothetical protein